MKELAKNAKRASKSLAALNKKKRYDVLTKMANDILKNKDRIEEENHKDLKLALENDLNKAMLDRLKLDSPRIEAMVEGVLSVRRRHDIR